MKKRSTLVLAAALCAVLATTSVCRSAPLAAESQMITQATLTRPAYNLTSVASSDARILLDPKESVALHLTFARTGEKVHLVAPNGGSINRQGGHLEMESPGNGDAVTLEFAVGKPRGKYTLEISQGNDTRTFEFWVGSEPPTGRPGPNLKFTGKH